jgi:hypothetical protein
MSAALTLVTAKSSSLPCLQGRVRVGCERSERQKEVVAPAHVLATCSYPLKHGQLHPSPPLLSQGRERNITMHASAHTPGTHA